MFPDRIKRVEEQIKIEIALILQQEMKDPRLGWLTVQSTSITRDLRNARIYVSVFDDGETDPKEVIKTLNSAAGFIRKTLGDRVDYKHSPELKFYLDDTPDQAQRLNELLDHAIGKSESESPPEEEEEP